MKKINPKRLLDLACFWRYGMKLIKTLVLFLIFLFIVMLCSGCLENNPMFEDSDNFLSFEEGDVYTCTINDDVNFWYSPIDMYGEWTIG